MPISVYGANYFATQYASLDLYLALCSVTPASSDTGATIVEIDNIAGVDYTRLYLDPLNWSTAVNGLSVYEAALSHSPVSYWGSINSWALLDAATIGAGNMYSYGNISPQIYAASGSYIELPIGSITIGVEL